MNENKFEILTSTESVVQKLKDYLKEDIIDIKVHCKNFGLYTQESFKNPNFKTQFHNTSLSFQIFSILREYGQNNLDKPEGLIKIHTFQALTEKNILDKINREQKTKDVFFLPESNNLIKVITSSEHLNIFVDFLQKFIDQIPSDKKPKRFGSISRVAELFFKHADKQEEVLNDALSFLKDQIISKANELQKKEGFDIDIQGEIHHSFNNLAEKLKSIKKDKNLSLWKASLIFFVEILPSLFDELSLSSYQDIFESIQRLYLSSSEVFNDKYRYTYLIPLFQLLATDITPALTLLTKSSLKEEIRLESKSAFYFLDYSNFNTSEQNHPFYLHLSYAIARWFEKIPTKLEEYTNYSTRSPENIQFNFKLFSKVDNRRISLFFSPYFNSHKLIQWIKEKKKESNQKIQTLEGKNYLILSQCPTKSNAGLSEALIQKLGYEIKDEINRTPQSLKLAQKPTDKHNPAIDYSKYEIKIDAKDNAPFVLSLSPFAFISKGEYPTYQESVWNFLPFFKSNDKEQRSALYIESFFRQEDELDAFFEKEEEIYQQVLDRFRNFAHTLYKQKYHMHSQTLEPQITQYRTCEILDVLSLVLLLKTIQDNYNHVSLSDYSVYINDDLVSLLAKETFFIPSHKSKTPISLQGVHNPHTSKQEEELIPLFVSSSNHTALNLESFINQMDQDIQKEELYEGIYSIVFDDQKVQEESIKTEYGELFLSFTQSFIDAFPFSFVLQDSQHLAPKLVNAILASPYAKELMTQFDAKFKIKKLCLTSSHQYRFYQLLSFEAQKYENISLDREFNIQQAISKALDAVIEEIPSAFVDAIKPTKRLLKNIFADFLTSLLGTFTHSIFISLAESVNTEFEKQKKIYQSLLDSKFTDKNNTPLALKREEGVYYPIAINQTSFNFSFSRYILGGRLCTGGMGELDTTFYILGTLAGNTTPNNNALNTIKILHLNILFMLLCLDELRDAKTEEKTEDHIFFEQNHSKKRFGDYVLDLDNQTHKAIYKSYGGGSGEDDGSNQASAIDSYQVIMEYFDEMKGGISDSNPKENTPNPQKHRIAIRALDQIGKNNLRGLYVGISKETDNEIRPKLIGRLATTIIMKDGLWIG